MPTNIIDSEVCAELAIEVLALRKELTELRQQLATEVRTRKVVVVDENDRAGVDVYATNADPGLMVHGAANHETIVNLSIDECSDLVWAGLDIIPAEGNQRAAFGLIGDPSCEMTAVVRS